MCSPPELATKIKLKPEWTHPVVRTTEHRGKGNKIPQKFLASPSRTLFPVFSSETRLSCISISSRRGGRGLLRRRFFCPPPLLPSLRKRKKEKSHLCSSPSPHTTRKEGKRAEKIGIKIAARSGGVGARKREEKTQQKSLSLQKAFS